MIGLTSYQTKDRANENRGWMNDRGWVSRETEIEI